MRPRVVTTRHIARGCGILADGAAQSRNPADLAGTMALVVGDSGRALGLERKISNHTSKISNHTNGICGLPKSSVIEGAFGL